MVLFVLKNFWSRNLFTLSSKNFRSVWDSLSNSILSSLLVNVTLGFLAFFFTGAFLSSLFSAPSSCHSLLFFPSRLFYSFIQNRLKSRNRVTFEVHKDFVPKRTLKNEWYSWNYSLQSDFPSRDTYSLSHSFSFFRVVVSFKASFGGGIRENEKTDFSTSRRNGGLHFGFRL